MSPTSNPLRDCLQGTFNKSISENTLTYRSQLEESLDKNLSKYEGGSSKLVLEEDFCYDVDLLKSIESLLQIDSVMEQINNPHMSSDDLMADVCDGQLF
jgi:hypothetical protein